MAKFDFFWKVWLRRNLLTKEVDNDYMAEVSTIKNSFRTEDIARTIVEAGSEITYDTILSILNRSDRIIREKLQQGYSVITGCCQFTPRVQGVWLGESDKFDPARHRVALDMIISADMRQALQRVGVEVLEVKDSGAKIGLVTDTLTGLTDGSITPNDDIRIEGTKIKVEGDASDSNLGVCFIDSTGASHPVTRRLTQNDPGTLIARVPALADGTYRLQVVTRHTGGRALLIAPRTIEYSQPLTVGGASGEADRPVIE